MHDFNWCIYRRLPLFTPQLWINGKLVSIAFFRLSSPIQFPLFLPNQLHHTSLFLRLNRDLATVVGSHLLQLLLLLELLQVWRQLVCVMLREECVIAERALDNPTTVCENFLNQLEAFETEQVEKLQNGQQNKISHHFWKQHS